MVVSSRQMLCRKRKKRIGGIYEVVRKDRARETFHSFLKEFPLKMKVAWNFEEFASWFACCE